MIYYGRVKSVSFENSLSSFYIFKVLLDTTGETITVKGNVSGLPVKEGSWFGFEAKKVQDPKYGEQYSIIRAPVLESWDDNKAFRALVAHGVSEMFLRQVHQHSNGDLIGLLSDMEALSAVKNVPPHVLLHIHEQWNFCRAYYQTYDILLNELKIPPPLCAQIWSHFGDRAIDILAKDPWELASIEGFTFPIIDQIATMLGLESTPASRTRALLLYVLRANRDSGHLFLDLHSLTNLVSSIDDTLDVSLISEALVNLHKEKQIYLDRKTRVGTKAVYEMSNYKAEQESAVLLRQRLTDAAWNQGDKKDFYTTHLQMALTTTMPEDTQTDDLVRAVVEQWSKANKITLTSHQQQGIINALLHPVSIITGLPGTGKTTSLRLLVRILQAAQINFLLVAPTGIAAKRLHNVTGATASTIHRAFKASAVSMDEEQTVAYEGVREETSNSASAKNSTQWEYGPHNPHPAQYVIVDESSMVDQALLERLLACTSSGCRVVMVGDAAQLPSVGPGNVLRDLISSGTVPVTSLTDIFRQDHISDIVMAAHQIHKGNVPDVQTEDFRLVESQDEDDVLALLLRNAVLLEKAKVNYQIISPRHAGTLGVTNLNTHLREALNPRMEGKAEIIMGKGTIRENDRVMVVKNHYDYGVFNGDLGRITKINHVRKVITVEIAGPTPQVVHFDFKDAALLRLAYASTVHKCQGQEWDQILMPIVPSFKHQLQRNLIYTAITRARSKVTLLGSFSAIEQAVSNDKESGRNTLFIERLLSPSGLG